MGHFHRFPLKSFKKQHILVFLDPKIKHPDYWEFHRKVPVPVWGPSINTQCCQECKNSAATENTWVPQKGKRRIKITLLPTNSTLRYILQRMENRNSNKYLYANVPRGTPHKSQKAETTQTSISGSMSKENVPHTHNGTLFTHRCYNMAEPQNHYIKWKKADTEGHMLYDHIHKEYSEITQRR